MFLLLGVNYLKSFVIPHFLRFHYQLLIGEKRESLKKLSHFSELYVADVEINSKNSLDNSGSNETMQKV